MAGRKVLVKVGEEGKYLTVDDVSTSVTSGTLLKVLKRDEAFEVELRDVPLSKCTVHVCASASKKAPSSVEEAEAYELEGADTLGDLALAKDLVGNLFIHVHLPPSMTAGAGAGAETVASRLFRQVFIAPPSAYSTFGGVQASLLDLHATPAEMSALPQWAANSGRRILNGRPGAAQLHIPLTVLHPVFGRFMDALAGPTPRSAPAATGDDDYERRLHTRTWRFMDAMASGFADEAARNTQLLEHLGPLIAGSFPMANVQIDGVTTDGTITVNNCVVLNLELKHSGDPEVQNDACLMRQTLRQPASGLVNMRARVATSAPLAPAFLVDVHRGTLMVVRGAVLMSPCLVTEELAVVSLVGRPGSAAHDALMRVLTALRAGVAELGRMYAGLPGHDSDASAWCTPPLFAHPAAALPTFCVPLPPGTLAGGEFMSVKATGIAPWLGEGSHSLVFTATLEGVTPSSPPPPPPRTVLLKLVRGRYGGSAHAAAAALGFAPRLLGTAQVPGGWTVVVTEALSADDGWEVYKPADPAQRAAVLAAYDTSVAGQGHVHGDLRPVNVLVRAPPRSSDTAVSVAFLDWDWAGPEGEAVYPPGLSEAIAWPEGAHVGAAITRQHDEMMLRGEAGGALCG